MRGPRAPPRPSWDMTRRPRAPGAVRTGGGRSVCAETGVTRATCKTYRGRPCRSRPFGGRGPRFPASAAGGQGRCVRPPRPDARPVSPVAPASAGAVGQSVSRGVRGPKGPACTWEPGSSCGRLRMACALLGPVPGSFCCKNHVFPFPLLVCSLLRISFPPTRGARLRYQGRRWSLSVQREKTVFYRLPGCPCPPPAAASPAPPDSTPDGKSSLSVSHARTHPRLS